MATVPILSHLLCQYLEMSFRCGKVNDLWEDFLIDGSKVRAVPTISLVSGDFHFILL
jgi:hypothetical protein